MILTGLGGTVNTLRECCDEHTLMGTSLCMIFFPSQIIQLFNLSKNKNKNNAFFLTITFLIYSYVCACVCGCACVCLCVWVCLCISVSVLVYVYVCSGIHGCVLRPEDIRGCPFLNTIWVLSALERQGLTALELAQDAMLRFHGEFNLNR